MKFDHAAHESGKGRPAAGCATLSQPVGPGQSIQIGIDTHNNCFACHTPDTKIGSCVTCHALGPYNRTTQLEYAFKAIFRHGDHTSRQGVSCNECHNVIAGVPNSRQVTNIQILEHLTGPGNNCLQCHNGRRAFTGNNPLMSIAAQNVTREWATHRFRQAQKPIPSRRPPRRSVALTPNH